MNEQLIKKTFSEKTTYENSSISLDSQLDPEIHSISNSQQSTFHCASDPLNETDHNSSNDAIVLTLPTIIETQQLCSEIKQISTKLWESKEWTFDTAIRRHLDLKFIKLRQLNRKMYQDKQCIKNKTHCAKVQMDLAHMKLQDVMFRKCLLKNMLSKLPRRFKFEDISLISLDEFMKTAPEQYLPVLSDNIDTKQRDHQLLLAQLRYEYAERIRLNDDYLEKLKKKEDALQRLKEKSNLYREINKTITSLIPNISSSPEINSSEHSNSMDVDN
ncbi:25061_t:CDS:2 [Gigaspora margarita]|uniref:25061_t:CDS:1 n=1 Tax=Gigaspora margarita TaxID=4874 RepID=A0ABM8W3V1_GIGMA|nr:25061_t:CDS:2 [Gigaspora margarita]